MVQSIYLDVDTHRKEINWTMLMAVFLTIEIFIIKNVIKYLSNSKACSKKHTLYKEMGYLV